MKIFDTKQIKELDAYIIEHEKISSFELMEYASIKCADWISGNRDYLPYERNRFTKKIKVFCGLGNNGGDGLVIARKLATRKFDVEVYIIRYSKDSSENNKIAEDNFLGSKVRKLYNIKSENDIPKIYPDDVIIDAIFGSGLNKPVEGLAKSRSEEHTSELQSLRHLVCRLLL